MLQAESTETEQAGRERTSRKREKQGMLGRRWTGPYMLLGHCPNSPISSLQTSGKCWNLTDHDLEGAGMVRRRLMAEQCVSGQGQVASLLPTP